MVNKFLLAEDKFISELHLRQPRFTYSACEPFTKQHEWIQKLRETSDLNHICKNELHRACFAQSSIF